MRQKKRTLIGVLLFFAMVMLAVPQVSAASASPKDPVNTVAAKKKSVKYAKKKLLKKIRAYKHNKRNKKILCSYYEKRGSKYVIFYLNVPQGDGCPPVGNCRVNLKTGKAKFIENYHWEKIKLPKGTFKLW